VTPLSFNALDKAGLHLVRESGLLTPRYGALAALANGAGHADAVRLALHFAVLLARYTRTSLPACAHACHAEAPN
jgi:hypothetical protein